MMMQRTGCRWTLLVIVAMVMSLSGCAGQQTGPRGSGSVPERPRPTEISEKAVVPRLNAETDEGAASAVPSGRAAPTVDASEEIVPKTVGIGPPEETPGQDPPARRAPRPAQPSKRPVDPPTQEEKGPKIVLNFDNADLYAVISTIAELLEINYIVDPSVTGKVTISTAGGLYKKDLFPVFFQILDVNGLTAIQEGNLYRIVPLKDSTRMSIETRLFDQRDDLPPMDRAMIQIIPLQFMAAQEMVKLLTPFVSSGGTIVSDTASNTLLVVDKGANVLKILRLVEAFDVNMLERVSYKVYPVKYLDVEEVANTLTDFTSSYGEVSNVFIKFIPITQLNTLFVVSTSPLVFERIEEILRQIDVIDKEVSPKIYVYFVKNGEAADLAQLMDSVFSRKSADKGVSEAAKKAAEGSGSVSRNPFSKERVAERKAEKEAAKSKAEAPAQKAAVTVEGEAPGSGVLMGEVHITPDEIRNALIVEALPSDYRIVEDILGKIDVLPRQVLIEATIAEITHESSRELGMEWALGKGAAAGKASFLSTIGAAGLKYSIGVTDKWYAELNALATKGLVNVISSPHVLASDNKEAKIDVSREVPVASGQTYVSSGSTISETAIEYRDTGVILSVTPHINDRGLVTMDISEEVSDVDEPVDVAGKNYPSFFKRTVTTTLTVKHGQTIAIGGLIKDRETDKMSGVPCLIDIPVVRYLAGQNLKETEKIELIVLLTPRVIANLDDVDAVTDEFKQKTRNIVKRFFPK
jgi:general secretion pathway protein D